MRPRPLAAILLVSTFSPFAFAQQDAIINSDAILRDLDRIELQQKGVIESARQAAIAQLRAAAGSGPTAADMYEDAVEAVQFDGKRNKAGTYADWKAANSDSLRSKEMQSILLLHLKYLILSLDRKASDKPELFAAPSLAFAAEVAQADSLFLKQGQRAEQLKESKDKATAREKDDQAIIGKVTAAKAELLDKPITDSVFTKWLRLDSYLPKGDWEMAAGNISGILEKNVRPVLRKTKNPQLIATWEFETKVLADRVTASRLQHSADDFNTVKLPQMQFARANDYAELGQPNRAATEIYAMVKAYPQHPDFKKWVTRLRELLKPAAPAAPESEAAATPAPAQ